MLQIGDAIMCTCIYNCSIRGIIIRKDRNYYIIERENHKGWYEEISIIKARLIKSIIPPTLDERINAISF